MQLRKEMKPQMNTDVESLGFQLAQVSHPPVTIGHKSKSADDVSGTFLVHSNIFSAGMIVTFFA
jgi:hypothetical protein